MRLFEILAVASPADYKAIEKLYEEFLHEQQGRMMDLLATQAAKDLTKRKVQEYGLAFQVSEKDTAGIPAVFSVEEVRPKS